MKTRNIYDIWASGVMRWHASPEPELVRSGDTTDAHAARCLRLLLCLWPDAGLPPSDLMAAVLMHDVPECVVGDVPGPAKTGDLHEALVAAEDNVANALGLVDVGYMLRDQTTPEQAAWIKLVDMLDAHLWAYHHAEHLHRDAAWRANRLSELLPLADELGVRPKVEALFLLGCWRRREHDALLEGLHNG